MDTDDKNRYFRCEAMLVNTVARVKGTGFAITSLLPRGGQLGAEPLHALLNLPPFALRQFGPAGELGAVFIERVHLVIFGHHDDLRPGHGIQTRQDRRALDLDVGEILRPASKRRPIAMPDVDLREDRRV